MSDQFNPNRIPVSIRARTEEQLQRLIVLSQQLNDKNWNLIGPPKLENKIFVVWFYDDITTHITVDAKMLDEGIIEKVKR